MPSKKYKELPCSKCSAPSKATGTCFYTDPGMYEYVCEFGHKSTFGESVCLERPAADGVTTTE